MGDLHVATGADAMLDGDESDAVLALEEAVVAVEEILVDSSDEAGAFGFEFLLTGIEVLLAGDERGHVGFDFLLLGGMGFLGGLE